MKIHWQGSIIGVQPRIRLIRSFDTRSHSYLGYVLVVDGSVEGILHDFRVAIGKAAQLKHSFHVGDEVEGLAEPVSDQRLELAEYYKASRLSIHSRGFDANQNSPPWTHLPPTLEIYKERGHRRLAARTYEQKCQSCIWGCKMPVQIIIDHWNPSKLKFRFETWCYGPKSCSIYRAGPTRKVPGRKGMIWEEEDWIDDESTSHRDISE